MSFDRTIRAVQNQTKINKGEFFEKYKIILKHKAQSACMMIPMPIIGPTFNIDILKIEHAFHMGYNEGEKGFYLSIMKWKGKEADIALHHLVIPCQKNYPKVILVLLSFLPPFSFGVFHSTFFLFFFSLSLSSSFFMFLSYSPSLLGFVELASIMGKLS